MEPRPEPQPRTDSDEYFPIAQVAKLFPVGLVRLRQMVKDGEIRASILPPAGKERPGRGRILIRPSEVKAWLRRQEERQSTGKRSEDTIIWVRLTTTLGSGSGPFHA